MTLFYCLQESRCFSFFTYYQRDLEEMMMESKGQVRSSPTTGEIPEPEWVKNIRSAAGAASIMGILAVSVLAFDFLKPWWEETIEDRQKQEKERGTIM